MEHLTLTGEISVGFVGFVAIFLIFARRDGKFEPHDALRIEALFTASFAALFMSLLPLVLSLSHLKEPVIWRLVSGLAFLVILGTLMHIGARQFKLPQESRAQIGLANNLFAWPAGIAVVTILAGITLNQIQTGTGFYYSLVIVLLLGISTSNFVAIAIQKFT